jgi:endonuclease YncB( thermonuclease family)
MQRESQLVEKAKGATMPAFRVTSIIDGDTFEVSPEWKWNGETGTRVRPAGYNAPEQHTAKGQKAKAALSKLINGQQVELRTAYKVDRGRLVCEVYVGSKNLAEFFPEY